MIKVTRPKIKGLKTTCGIISGIVFSTASAENVSLPDYLCTTNPDIVASFEEGNYPTVIFGNTAFQRKSEIKRICFGMNKYPELIYPPESELPVMKYVIRNFPIVVEEGDSGSKNIGFSIHRYGEYYEDVTVTRECPSVPPSRSSTEKDIAQEANDFQSVKEIPLSEADPSQIQERLPVLACEPETYTANILRDLTDKPGAIQIEFSGSALYGIDYGNVRLFGKGSIDNNMIDFSSGEKSKYILLDIWSDTEIEDDEIIEISFSSLDTTNDYADFFTNRHPFQINILDDDRINTFVATGRIRSGPSYYSCDLENNDTLESGSSIFSTYYNGSSIADVYLEYTDDLQIEDAAICKPWFSNLTNNSLPALLAEPEGHPVIDRIVSGDSSLIISFSNLLPETDVTIFCTPLSGGIQLTVQGNRSPLTIEGLKNGEEYQCRVMAKNLISAAITATPRAALNSPRGIPTIGPSLLVLLSMLLGLIGILFPYKGKEQ